MLKIRGVVQGGGVGDNNNNSNGDNDNDNGDVEIMMGGDSPSGATGTTHCLSSVSNDGDNNTINLNFPQEDKQRVVGGGTTAEEDGTTTNEGGSSSRGETHFVRPVWIPATTRMITKKFVLPPIIRVCKHATRIDVATSPSTWHAVVSHPRSSPGITQPKSMQGGISSYCRWIKSPMMMEAVAGE